VGRKFEYLRLAGGGAQSGAWAQILADVTGVPVRQTTDPRNGSVMGIALLALNRLGLVKVEEFSSLVTIAHVFEPRRENRAIHDKLFRQFMACQKNLKPVFHALNGS
jgi:xylulokinase